MLRYIKDNLGLPGPSQPRGFNIQASSTYTTFTSETSLSSTQPEFESPTESLGEPPLPPMTTSLAFRSLTLPTEITSYCTEEEMEPLRDYVTDLTTSYESIVSSAGRSRAGPKVSGCIEELETRTSGILNEIKDLTEHREALDDARELELGRKQIRYVGVFLKSNYDLELEFLNLRTRYLSIKYAFLSGMVKELLSLDPSSVAPSYLQMRTFQDWLKHSPIMDDIQDKMLQVRTRKVRLKRAFIQAYFKDSSIMLDHREEFRSFKRFSVHLNSVSNEMTFMKGDIDDIHKQLAQILRDAKNSQHQGIDVLGSLLNDPKSFESRKLDEYVRECQECEPEQGRGEEWTSILVFEDNFNSQEHFAESVPGANPSRYQEFLAAMTQYVSDKLKHAGVTVDPISVFGALDQKVLPKVFTLALSTVANPHIDGIIREKCLRLRGYTQQQIGIPEELVVKDPLPYYSAISRFKSLVFSLTPTKIMEAISYAATDIHSQIKLRCPTGVVGADSFLPIWVYCIIKANIPNLATLVNFLKGYLNPDLRYCEVGYYVTCLEGACVYIQDLEEFDLYTARRYLIFDKDRYKTELEDKGLFSYLQDYSLSGFKLYVNPATINKAHCLHSCSLLPTGSESDVVHGGLVAPGPEITNVQLEFLEGMMCEGDLEMVSVEEGVLSVGRTKVEEKEVTSSFVRAVRRLSTAACDLVSRDVITPSRDVITTSRDVITPSCDWLDIAEGDYDKIKWLMKLVISLYWVGVWDGEERDGLLRNVASGTIVSLPEAAYARLAIKYGFYVKDDNEAAQFTSQVQILLRYLNYYSVFLEINGVLSEITSDAIMTFQKDQNCKEDYVEKLPETGFLCKSTYNRLKDVFKIIMADLKKLGYQFGFNPLLVQNVDKMTTQIEKIQTHFKIGLYVRGSFCSKTRSAIQRNLYESQVAAWYHPYNTIAMSTDTLYSRTIPTI